jgi:ubiquinone/menaquinone biosynthesis C-methylase UbiE
LNQSISSPDGGVDFLDVSELAGSPISGEQLERLRHRYTWAMPFSREKDVAELACGTGPGLGLLAGVARSLVAGDYSERMLERVRAHYGDRVALARFDASSMPYDSTSKDVLVIFEALYYLPDVARFAQECKRVLRPGGVLLIATANKDLSDFNPSPYSHDYLGVQELHEVFGSAGFDVRCFGHLDTAELSWKQRLLRPVKKAVVSLNLMPRTMRGKQILKRLVFGKPVSMPAELSPGADEIVPPTPLTPNQPDRRHKVIYCAASLPPASR